MTSTKILSTARNVLFDFHAFLAKVGADRDPQGVSEGHDYEADSDGMNVDVIDRGEYDTKAIRPEINCVPLCERLADSMASLMMMIICLNGYK